MRICKNCLHELNDQQNICPICQTKFTQVKKRKTMKYTAIILVSLIVFSATIIFGSRSYYSAENIESRFIEAIEKRNWTALKSIVVHEDSSKISDIEAKAIIDLVKLDGELRVEDLFHVIEHNELLHTYKMTASPVSIKDSTSIKFQINQLSTKQLMPGRYPVNVTLNPKSLAVTKKKMMPIRKKNTNLAKQLDLQTIELYPFPFDDYVYDHLQLRHKKQTTSFSDIIENGPLLRFTDVYTDHNFILKTPWGEVESTGDLLSESLDFNTIQALTKHQIYDVNKIVDRFLIAVERQQVSSFKEGTTSLKKQSFKKPTHSIRNIMDTPPLNIYSIKQETDETFLVMFQTDLAGDDTYTHAFVELLYNKQNNTFLLNNFHSSEDFSKVPRIIREWKKYKPEHQRLIFTSYYEGAISSSSSKKLMKKLPKDFWSVDITSDVLKVNPIDDTHVNIKTVHTTSNKKYEGNFILEEMKPDDWKVSEIVHFKTSN